MWVNEYLFPQAMRKIAVIAWIFDECGEEQRPNSMNAVRSKDPIA